MNFYRVIDNTDRQLELGIKPTFTEFNLIGSRASGKTFKTMDFEVGCFLSQRNNIIYIFRENHSDLDNYKSELFPKLEEYGFKVSSGINGSYNAKTNMISNGYNKIIFKALNAERMDVSKGKGAGLPVWKDAENIIAIFEEATQMKQELVDITIQGLRGNKDTNVLLFFCANPWSPLNWYVKKCNKWLPENQKELEEKGFQMFMGFDSSRNKNIVVIRNNLISNPFCAPELKNEINGYKDANYNQWLITYLGMSGVLGDLIYATNMNKMLEVDYNFVNGDSGYFQGGMDWGDGTSIGASPTTLHFGKISQLLGVHIIDELTIWNNQGKKHTTNEQIDIIVKWYGELYAKYREPFKVYLDSAALSDFAEMFNSRLYKFGLSTDYVEFIATKKPPIMERIHLTNTMISTGFYRVDKSKCPELYSALMNSTWVNKEYKREGTKKERRHDETHWINSGAEYILGDEYTTFISKWTYMFNRR